MRHPPDRPREHALSAALLSRVFHQPSLIYFNAVATYLSIREAARRLDVASSAVTRQVAQLEDALGIALFLREKRRLRLSPAGEILFRHSRRLAAPIEAAVSEIELLRGVRAGSVRIATAESVGLSFLPDLISDFGKRYPRLTLDVSIIPSAEVIERLVDERIDIGFGFIAKPPRQVDIAFRRDVSIGVVMSPAHPLASVDRLTVAQCLDYPLAVGKPEISIREVIEPFLRGSSGITPPMVEVNSIRLLVELALGGHYASIMTPIGAQHEIAAGRLIFRPLGDSGLPTNRFGIMVRSGSSLHLAPAIFYDHAKAFFEGLALPGAIQP
ncbi:DNA-binding transcriptional regulator, LysR family [Devosia lucknowensis]|uniref:DNA-binding transcriptional regulator, LysR family n=1 Tax=Devosia lucknowensis TaxID=1096929 RepID=A0A1Y6FAX1_9HYPH|nr:LysR family transcriptional regulator [Devosia lucknowensis]SMQ72078.1 DNA-binding transcriptional regulator, LysR family [Devosia lucknowensis]